MKRSESRVVVTLVMVLVGFMAAAELLAPRAFAAEPYLQYEFENEDELFDFFGPPAAIGCGANLPMGMATVDDGELVLTNGAGGASILALLPEVVEDNLPEPRDYRVRMRVNFETHTGIFYVFVRTRIGVNEEFDVLDITDELGYVVYLDVTSQVFGFIEESNCNVPVPHPEWPGNGIWALSNPGFPIETGEFWYWMEIEVSGDDDGGPVQLTARTWPDGEDPPDAPQFVLEDPTGLLHTDTTREPSRDVQLLFLNLFGVAGQTVRIDDVTVSSLEEVEDGDGPFIRADSNNDGTVNIADGVATLNWLFQGNLDLPCQEAADVNDDGKVDLSDPVATFNLLFSGAEDPSAPYPACGTVSDDSLGCEEPLAECE